MVVTSVIAAITTNWAFSQTTIPEYPFCYMKNDKVYLKNEEIFLKTCNYIIRLHRGANGQLLVGPSGNYFNMGDSNYPTTQEGLTQYMHAHFSLMKQMGFNSVRIMLLSVEPRWNSTNGDLAYRVWARDPVAYPITESNRIRSRSEDAYDDWYYYEDMNDDNYDDYLNAVNIVLDVAESYNLKVILVTGIGMRYVINDQTFHVSLLNSSEINKNKYKAFLTKLSTSLRDNSALFAYELFHELESFNNVAYDGNPELPSSIPKAEIASLVKEINDVVKTNDPNHYTTAGLFNLITYFKLGIEPFQYVDFLNFHIYECEMIATFAGQFGISIQQAVTHFNRVLDIPWMIGETGIETPPNGYGEKKEIYTVTEAQQKDFANFTLTHTRKCGGIGYAWWEFQNETGWNNNGLLKSAGTAMPVAINIPPYSYGVYSNFKEIVSPPSQSVFITNNATFGDCIDNDNSYYSIMMVQNDNLQWDGTVEDNNGFPIEHAVILLQCLYDDNDPDTKNDLKQFYTFTRDDGSFSLKLPEGGVHHARVSISKPGYSIYYESFWSENTTKEFVLEPIVYPIPENYNSTVIEVNNNETYTIDYTRPISQIRINNGGTLIVNDTLFFDENSQLQIYPGGKLILNQGAVLTAIHNAWLGIVMSGDNAENQAQIISTGNCIIAKASQGISAHNNVVIDLKKVNFINNYHDVMITGQNVIINEDLCSTINFEDCNFTLTADALPQYSVSNSCDNFVKIEYTTHAKFVNCHFADERNFTMHIPNKTGIYAYNVVSLEVLPDPLMSFKKSSFNNLKYGIFAFSDGIGCVLTVKNTDFKTIRGIYMYNYMNFSQKTITNNNFEILDYSYAIECESQEGKAPVDPNLPPDNTIEDLYRSYGIYIDECSNSYTIEGNSFHGDNDNPDNKFGIVAKNNGDISKELYRNTYSYLLNPIQCIGRNRSEIDDGQTGLYITCNKFTNSKTDIFVTGGNATSNQGIARNQGLPSFPAGNLFSDNNNLYNIKNDVAPINYYHRRNSDPNYNYQEFPTSINGSISVLPLPSNYNGLFCPDNTSSTPLIDPDVLWGEMNVALQAENNIDQTLATLTDGGNTPLTVAEVALASDYNAWQTYLSLIAKSPYLSEEVLKVIAGKEYALTAPMVRDVLVANPQAAKDPAIQKILDERIDKLPDYMIEQIKLGMMQMSPKEFLEMQKAEQRRMYENNMLALLNHYSEKADSTNAYNDSIVMVLKHRTEPQYLMLLAQHYFSLGETRLANQTLGDILTQFEMDELETKGIEVLQEYYVFYASLIADTAIDMQQLDSLNIDILKDFESSGGLAGTRATALLMLNGASDYREPVYLPEEDPNQRNAWLNKSGTNSVNNFKIYPNPAGDYFYVEYQLEGEDAQLLLVITDVLGKTVFTKELKHLQDVVIVRTDGFIEGQYHVSLLYDKSLAGSSPISIKR